MGVLFASMPYNDIEEERRKTEEQRRRADDATENVIRQIIETVQDRGQIKSYATDRLVNKLNLSGETAAKKVALYWKE